MTLSRRRVLQAAAIGPIASAMPGLGGSAAATPGSPIPRSGTIVDADGLLGLSLSWGGDPHAGAVARVQALVDGSWGESIEVQADHDHGPPDPAGRLHGPAVLVEGAAAFRITTVLDVDDLRHHVIKISRGPLRTLAAGPSTVEPIPGLSIIERSNWTSRVRKDTVDCTILSSVSGLGCRSDVGLRHGVVHHTVNTNGYSEAGVPSLLRGIQSFHMDTRGWDDIAYNFVIDRFGRIWHARDGAIDQPITGGHTLGFNTESVGVAVLGTFTSAAPSQAVVDALGTLLGWKLGIHGVDPHGTTIVRSSGGDRTAAGDTVDIPNLTGHRELQQTSCPGEQLYVRIGDVRTSAAELVPVFGYVSPTYRPDEIELTGWSIDRFAPTSAVAVDVVVDGASPTVLTADLEPTDLPSQYLGTAGSAHGFAHIAPITLDTTSIVVTSRAGDGRTAKLMDLKLFATFIDVEPDRFFAPGVRWMREHDLTFGTQPGLFEPMDEMTRGQMATFLHRFMDLAPPSGPMLFTDVVAGRFYATAVHWLFGTGITKGRTATRFAPDDFLTRAEMAVFLWRLCGELPAARSPFIDVERPSFYDKAVDWLHALGITSGRTATRFAPYDTMTRGEMAAFLRRLAANPQAWTAVTPPSVVNT